MADLPDQNPAGAPRQQVSAADRGAMDAALQTMSQMDTRVKGIETMVDGLVRHFSRIQANSKDTERSLDRWGTELSSVLKQTANLEYTMKRIQQLQKARVAAGSSQQGTIAFVKNLQAEASTLFRVLNKTQGAGRYTREYAKILKDLNRELKVVKKTSEQAWDSSHVAKVNAELARMSKNIDSIANSMKRTQVKKFTDGFKDIRNAMDNAFGMGFSGDMLGRIPMVKQLMSAKRFRDKATSAQANLAELEAKRRMEQQARMRANAAAMVDQFGPRARGTMAKMGYTPQARTGIRSKSVVLTPTQRRAAAAGGVAPAAGPAPASQLVGLDGLPLITSRPAPAGPSRGGMLQRGITGYRGRFANAPAAPSIADVQQAMGGSGSGFSRILNRVAGSALEGEGKGMMASAARSLVSKGGGSVTAGLGESALSGTSGLLSGGLELASKAAVPLAIVKGLIDVRDRVATERKKIQDTLGGYGIHGAGAGGVDFTKVRSTLLSTGFGNAALMGQGLAENMDIMKTLGEGGYATGRTLRTGGVDLGAALSEKQGLTGNGFYGSLMKNTVYNGRNLGLSPEASVRLNMKLMDKFQKTTESTQEFFLHLDDMMQSSGVSVSKYIDIVDNLTDQFNDMNKNLDGTVTILNTLGKSGRLTGDAMQKMVKDLTTPNQMNTAQRMFNAMSIVKSGGAGMTADMLEGTQKHEFAQIQKTLFEQHGIKVDNFEDLNKNRAGIETQLATTLAGKPEELKTITDSIRGYITRIQSARAQSTALRSGRPDAIAAATEQYGESGPLALATKMGSIQTIVDAAGLDKDTVQRLMRGDQSAYDQFAAGSHGALTAARLAKGGTLQSDFDLMGTLNSMRDVGITGATNAMGFAQGVGSVGDLLKSDRGQDKYDSILRLQRARQTAGLVQVPKGLQGEDADKALVGQFLQQANGNKAKDLANELAGLTETVSQSLDANGPMASAMQGIKDALDKQAAEDKTKEIKRQTTTTAEIFAQSFDYLFQRVVNILDSILHVLDIGGRHSASEADIRTFKAQGEELKNALAGVDDKTLSPENRQRRDAFLAADKDQSLYTGSASDIQHRMEGHASWIQRLTGKPVGGATPDVKLTKSGGGTISLANGGNYDAWYKQASQSNDQSPEQIGELLASQADKGLSLDDSRSNLRRWLSGSKAFTVTNDSIKANDPMAQRVLESIKQAAPALLDAPSSGQGGGTTINNYFSVGVMQANHAAGRVGRPSPVAAQVTPTTPSNPTYRPH